MTGKEMIKYLKRQGFEVLRIKGSHYRMKKGNVQVTVPYHNTELKPKTENSILKQAGLK